ncbi:20-hydroxyecdysone protein [Ceratitis capitata]|uniref:20-hydroxyecdysone protein n=1 Tax=Ceratitis capitata TaxID=7213 RepID=UPI00032A3DE9|nr:20-hydroxyecdysone protein [Ceratitis capitata]
MRQSKFGLTPTILLFLAASAQAGLVHRQNRNANSIAATAPLLGSESLIPVQIIQDGQQLEAERIKAQSAPLQTDQSEQLKIFEAAESPALLPVVIAEPNEQSIETAETAEKANNLRESEQKQDVLIIEQELKQAIVDENRELLQAAAGAETILQTAGAPEQLPKQAQDINTETRSEVPAAALEAGAPAVPAIAEEVNESDPQKILKSESLVVENLETDAQNAEPTKQPISNEPLVAEASLTPGQVRQAAAAAGTATATQATPAQTTTQQNFVQQLIQNSPFGQFFGQLTGQQQQQQQQQQQLASPGIQVAADQPATPAPTLPGFLNPQNAITQVQNAAQSVANATAQAFQGVQQFATNLGTQFQSTLSNLGGQQQQQTQLSTADSTTVRPPGPIQSLISNFVGGNPPAGAAAAAGATQNPAQQQGPFQGIITFLQGGNRPQTGAAVAAAPVAAVATTVDNKVDEVKKDEQQTDALVEPEETQGEEGDEVDQSANEVRNSAEVGLDSLEDSNADQLIVVDDDGSQQERKVKV